MVLSKWLTALTLISVGLVVQAQKLPTGSYVYEGGNGELRIEADGNFTIDTIGGNAHACTLEGEIKGQSGWIPESSCVVTFTPEGNNIRVTNNEYEDCRYSCGMRASYTGLYIRPSQACTIRGMEITRRKFKMQYDKKKFSAAVQTLAPLLKNCIPVLPYFEQGAIRNDMALAQLRSGDASGCLKTLFPLQEFASRNDADLGWSSEPTYEDAFRLLAKATRTNLKLCNAAAH